MEDIIERFSQLDNRIKIASALGLLLVTGFIGSSFGNMGLGSSGAYSTANPQSSSVAADLARGESGADSEQTESRIVTNVRMTLRVPDVSTAMNDITAEVEELDGMVESSSVDRGDDNTGRLTVKVPDSELETFESELESDYRVKSRNVDNTDVADSYNQLEAELESLRAEQTRLRELINQTDDVENLIKIQERLSEVNGQIDYKSRRFERLQEEVSYSTVYITLEGPQNFRSQFEASDTFVDAYRAIFDSLRLMIIGAAYLVPFGVLYGFYRLIKRLRDRGF